MNSLPSLDFKMLAAKDLVYFVKSLGLILRTKGGYSLNSRKLNI